MEMSAMSYQNEIFGGLLIGVASAIPLLYEGRIAGVSGYAASAMRPSSSDGRTGLLLVLGLMIGGLLWRLTGAEGSIQATSQGLGTWALAGLLVGWGSRMGGGCTSGHGVCGLGRLSPRSLVSVLIFMGIAVVTNLLLRGVA